jgi:hypothetical protein
MSPFQAIAALSYFLFYNFHQVTSARRFRNFHSCDELQIMIIIGVHALRRLIVRTAEYYTADGHSRVIYDMFTNYYARA